MLQKGLVVHLVESQVIYLEVQGSNPRFASGWKCSVVDEKGEYFLQKKSQV